MTDKTNDHKYSMHTGEIINTPPTDSHGLGMGFCTLILRCSDNIQLVHDCTQEKQTMRSSSSASKGLWLANYFNYVALYIYD